MVLRFCFFFAFLLVLGCSYPYERDNPTDPYHVYKVTFNASDATGGTAPVAIIKSYGDIVTLPDQGSLVKSGYVFGGWADPAGRNYTIGSSYTVTSNLIFYAVWFSCSETNYYCDIRDDEQARYKIITIGTQTWMAENLNYNAGGSKCYDNLNSNCDKYGRLYNWSTAINVCPSGWHLPTKAEWEVMTAFIGGEKNEGKKLKATTGWNSNGNGIDEYGFSALPGGYGNSDGSFYSVGNLGLWWSANEYDSNYAYYRDMYYNYDYAYWNDNYKSNLFSVRCVQD